MSKLAVVLFNLGAPDSLASVRPFLLNLFNDPAIIAAPAPVRWLLARMIGARRAPVTRRIYAKIGGRSPLLELTRAQAAALEARLGAEARVFVAMRYWHPLSDQTAAAVASYGPDEVVLLPLYPQYSTTTTASSLKEWRRAARAAALAAPTFAVCCYPTAAGFVEAQANRVRPAVAKAARQGAPRILFSAHGLPKRIAERGDPYTWQVERTAAALAGALGGPDLDFVVCYQSRVGPLAWTGPATADELRRAAADRVPAVVVPISFVSEHSETLVELDIDYRKLAEDLGIPAYERVPAVGVDEDFIGALADVVGTARAGRAAMCSGAGGRLCPASFAGCPLGRPD